MKHTAEDMVLVLDFKASEHPRSHFVLLSLGPGVQDEIIVAHTGPSWRTVEALLCFFYRQTFKIKERTKK